MRAKVPLGVVSWPAVRRPAALRRMKPVALVVAMAQVPARSAVV